MTRLADRHCVPCGDRDFPPMTRQQAKDMLPLVPLWKMDDAAKEIARDLRFPDFKSALAFVNEVGELAEAEGHHPDVSLSWGRVRVRLSTHEIGGLSENDFVLAARIDLLPAARIVADNAAA